MKMHLLFLFLLLVSAARTIPPNYVDYEQSLGDSYDLSGEQILYGTPMKRSCIVRGGNCDHRAEECCESTSCRCNLWGANCRCQRKGLFTKLG